MKLTVLCFFTLYNFSAETDRFAIAGSLSKRRAHRFEHLRERDYVDINPMQRHPGWTPGEIRRLDETSGQVQVVYESMDKNYLYWSHLDNIAEIAEFTSKSGTVHATQVEILHNVNQYAIGDVLEVRDTQTLQWVKVTVIDRERNWIIVHFHGETPKCDQRIHVGRHQDRLRYWQDNERFEEKEQENEVVIWIRDTLKMPQYLDVFKSQGFDQLDMLRELEDCHLRELGIHKMGHRFKILKAIRQLNEEGADNDLNDFDEQAEGDLATNHGSQ